MGQEAGVGDHAVVGSHRLAVDMPCALQYLERLDHAERGVGEFLAQPGDLADRGQVCEQDAAGVHGLLGVLDHSPGLGQIEQHAVEVGRADAFVHVAHLDREGRAGTEEARDVRPGAASEVVADLVTGDVTGGADGAEQREW